MTEHGVVTPGRDMRERSEAAVADPVLQDGLRNIEGIRFLARWATGALRELREQAHRIRRETLDDLDGWTDRLEATLTANGVTVHRAATADDACRVVLDIARSAGARRVVKGKSMATEEIELNDALEAAGLRVVETDLGEYIIQLAGERPSHMIGPALHKPLSEVREILSKEAGAELPLDRDALCAWARGHLRPEFLAADLGITGVNFAAADTGTLVLVTNEGNGRLCTTWPRVHVAVMAVEKVVPRFADLSVLLPLLTTTATGQRLSTYVTMLTGPRRDGEVDGPEELHLVILDRGRRALVGTPYEEMLACIRCAACLNVCPVYGKVSGHAYDAVYSGPLGKILTPLLSEGAEGCDLPEASTLCGACSDACPVGIPLADLIVRLRSDLRGSRPFTPAPSYPAGSSAPLPVARVRTRSIRASVLRAWARAWSSPAGYRITTRVGRSALRLAHRIAGLRRVRRPSNDDLGVSGVQRDWLRRLPGAGSWTAGRDLPTPASPVLPRAVGATYRGGRPVVTPTDDDVDAFLAAAAMNMCATRRASGAAAGAEAVAAAVRRHARGGLVALPVGDACLDALGVEAALRADGCTVLRADDAGWRRRLPEAAVGVTGAAVAVAEQGVVGLASGPGSPRGTSLLPPAHVCVVRAADIVATFVEGILRAGEGGLPSALTWVGGPSRTGDLGMTLTLGVHGPGAVEIVVVDLP